MYIIGINAFHGDSSACILKDGRLIAAAEEERFRRIKHWAGFPSEAIKWCLSEAGIGLENVEHIALNQDVKANLLRKIIFTFKNRPNLKMLLDRLKNKRKRLNINDQILKVFSNSKFNGSIHAVEHHAAHLSSAFHTSNFNEAVVVSVDGFGDFASTAFGIGKGTKINLADRVYFPHSLGIFYQALTQYIGFHNYGDEYKVMGLAPYGKPVYIKQLRDIVKLKSDGTFELNLKYFRHHREKIDYEWEKGSPHIGTLFSPDLEKLLGSARGNNQELTQKHKDIAHSVQLMYEEAFFHLLNKLYKRYKIDNLSISGGCGMNSVANGKVSLKTPFKKIYIQAAAGDAGGAIGAALMTWHKIGGKKSKERVLPHDHAYWGPSFTDDYISDLLKLQKNKIKKENCLIENFSEITQLTKHIASEIAEGKVIGWFQGKMEWGPRALGNRSIVCDPRRSDMKDILNLKIKRRESFRPFAPSILSKEVSEWFEQNDDVPFMMQVYQIKKNKRSIIPAVTHVDGSGRLQTVDKKNNPRYYSLINEFKNLTGVPMVLNTSFNENEPVVCKPEEALETFLRTKMDILVIGDWIIKRNN
ncbi:nodulation protein nolNO [Candidatus Pelagibacter sp. HTCC7211]|uniref:carbamoyltransferase family protein n=1 Tax=Pelagibacter sp. (strain HTCC7211) TaxID=439493 RepID=UPI000183A1DB|nr:carbamoyltransferase C-terminal domain-containing protein [Candidatus Pelagibacter sp. HTCC7211]EDZ60771.1 nodulation protein nolNO [Candidatus Pelagibacter sp. HTCC7211]MBD1151127.1 carbamoyltransferase [Pelagibacterales bacterium SAG-MED25]